MRRELIRRGSAKDVFRLGDGRLELSFVDELSVFGHRLELRLPGKGALMCEAATRAMQLVEAAGLRTHLVERSGDTSIIIAPGYPTRQAVREGGPVAAFALECVTRHRLGGSLLERARAGQSPIELPSSEPGSRLSEPLVEFCRRNSTSAVYMRPGELELREQARGMAEASLAADACLADALSAIGLVHVDGKKEFAFASSGELMLVDCFATVDEDRIWRWCSNGTITELSLDGLRRHYRRPLIEGRDLSRALPPSPDLLDALIESYREVAVALPTSSGITSSGMS
jgi:phosphoribosylaminoimidazole-succinocarboxamide synthase